MEGLLDTLEGLLDNSGQPDWEVDYHVRFFFFYVLVVNTKCNTLTVNTEWCPNTQTRFERDVCHQ